MSLVIALGLAPSNLKTLSITDTSVLVVSRPQKAIQSLATMPAPITSLPLLTVPAYKVVDWRYKSMNFNWSMFTYLKDVADIYYLTLKLQVSYVFFNVRVIDTNTCTTFYLGVMICGYSKHIAKWSHSYN